METVNLGKHSFVIVETVPHNHTIWNIGKNMIDGYLPLVQVGGYNGCEVIGVKKAIKVTEAQVILSAIAYGDTTLKKMNDYIEKYQTSNKPSKMRRVDRYKKAVEIMCQIDGVENLC